MPDPKYVSCLIISLMIYGYASPGHGEVMWPKATHWQQLAAERVAVDGRPASLQPVDAVTYMRRNTRITSAYAEIFLRNQDRYYWTGLAAYASAMVGRQMQENHLAAGQLWPANRVYADSVTKLGIGNTSVFLDIYWQHLAYEAGGIDLMLHYYRTGNLHRDAYLAWQNMHRGEMQDDRGAIWQATVGIAKFEQLQILQPRVFSGVYELLAGSLFASLAKSPIPGGQPFTTHAGKLGNVSVFSMRWSWIENVVINEWRQQLEKNYGEQTLMDMDRFLTRDGWREN